MSRDTNAATLAAAADCQACPWRTTGNGALGNAARHHDATGHAVTVDVTRRITYGDPTAAAPGQTSLLDALAETTEPDLKLIP